MLENFLLENLLLMLYLLSFIFLGGLVIHFIEGACERRILRTFGYTGIVVTGFGVVIHELSHYIFAKLGGMRINEVSLFRPIKGRTDGQLGYVNYSYNKRNMYHILFLLFTGIAPIIGGTIFILLLLMATAPSLFDNVINMGTDFIATQGGLTLNGIFAQVENVFVIIKEMFSISNLTNPIYLISLFLIFSVASHMSLSKEDIKGAVKGIPAVYILIILGSILLRTIGIGFQDTIQYIGAINVYIVTFMIIAITFSLINYCAVWLVSSVYIKLRGKKVVL